MKEALLIVASVGLSECVYDIGLGSPAKAITKMATRVIRMAVMAHIVGVIMVRLSATLVLAVVGTTIVIPAKVLCYSTMKAARI